MIVPNRETCEVKLPCFVLREAVKNKTTTIFIKEMICGVKLHGLSVISLLYDEMGSASCCENQPVIQISEKKHLDLSGFHSQTDPVYILAF